MTDEHHILSQTLEPAPEPTPELKLIVCLGNPGEQYVSTRHNAGWQVADALIMASETAIRAEWQPDNGEIYQLRLPGKREIYLLKPLTYMNLSGEAVLKVSQHFAISPGELLVVCDCLDLPVGRLRLRKQGSSGGQRGVESIIRCLGTVDFPRLRIGIGRPEPGGEDIVSYVLSSWASVDEPKHAQVLQAACETIGILLSGDQEAAIQFASTWRYAEGE